MVQYFKCNKSKICRRLKHLKITCKKNKTRYNEQNSKKVTLYLQEICDIPKEKIVYVGETNINTCLY